MWYLNELKVVEVYNFELFEVVKGIILKRVKYVVYFCYYFGFSCNIRYVFVYDVGYI